jgi:hypothetical protein
MQIKNTVTFKIQVNNLNSDFKQLENQENKFKDIYSDN